MDPRASAIAAASFVPPRSAAKQYAVSRVIDVRCAARAAEEEGPLRAPRRRRIHHGGGARRRTRRPRRLLACRVYWCESPPAAPRAATARGRLCPQNPDALRPSRPERAVADPLLR